MRTRSAKSMNLPYRRIMRYAFSDLALQCRLTRPMRFTPLQASVRLPSRVGIMLRTTPPPDGITQVWNCSVLGSKRTIVFGCVPDSLYHRTSWMAAMPYGSDLGPPGDGHSLVWPVAGSKRPR